MPQELALPLPYAPVLTLNTERRGLLARMRTFALHGLAWFTAFMVIGNLAIMGFHVWARSAMGLTSLTPAGIENFEVVDDVLFRGSRPTEQGYSSLAALGVSTIVDLRAEEGASVPQRLVDKLEIDVVRIPLRDGQVPTDDQLDRFIQVMRDAPGKVYVHCMAGVGRTGAMVGAYLVEVKNVSPLTALSHNLAVGPPSLEQIVYVAGDTGQPNPIVTVMSRVLDGPRRLLTYIT